MLGPPNRYRFFFGRGMVSDDTEHTCMVAQSLIDARCETDKIDIDIFVRRFARRLRWWMLALPAGVGKATARSGIKLWLGAKPKNAGVFSAGNGPAMRAAIFGASIDDLPMLLQVVRKSSRLTHTDPKAEYGAIAVALAARESWQNSDIDADRWLANVFETFGDGGAELIELLNQSVESVKANQSTRDFADSLGLNKGITGYTYHTVPVAIHAWPTHPRDFRFAVATIIECGGDADTSAAIVGGIVGAGVGREGIPAEWIEGIWEWPRSVRWMESLGRSLSGALAEGEPKSAPRVNPIAALIRNLLFFVVVLFHGFRRLAPPY